MKKQKESDSEQEGRRPFYEVPEKFKELDEQVMTIIKAAMGRLLGPRELVPFTTANTELADQKTINGLRYFFSLIGDYHSFIMISLASVPNVMEATRATHHLLNPIPKFIFFYNTFIFLKNGLSFLKRGAVKCEFFE